MDVCVKSDAFLAGYVGVCLTGVLVILDYWDLADSIFYDSGWLRLA